MCRPTTCRTCGNTTWAGCGRHVAQVKATVPAGQWCAGHDASSSVGSATAPATAPSPGRGWLARLTGR